MKRNSVARPFKRLQHFLKTIEAIKAGSSHAYMMNMSDYRQLQRATHSSNVGFCGILLDSFTWNKSKEGALYWVSIHDALVKLYIERGM